MKASWRASGLSGRFRPAVAFAAALLAAAGVFMAFRYEASSAGAHESVKRIAEGPWAWVRGVHYWAATILLLAALGWLAYLWLRAVERVVEPSRWFLKVAALGVLLGAFLTGGILAWDHQGWESWQHVASTFALVSGRAPETEDPGTTPLRALFLLHVLAVPVAFGAIGGLYLSKGGRLSDRLREIARGAPKELAAAWPALVVVMALAFSSPPSLGPAPIPGVAVSNPEWPFLWLVPIQDALGPWGLPLGLGMLAGTFAGAPWLARIMSERARRLTLLLVSAALLGLSLRAALR